MKTNRFAHAALGLLTLAAALGAAPALPEALDPARTVRSEVLGEAAPRLDVSAGGVSHTRVDWAPGALLALEQEDGVTRFAVEGAGEPESEGLPLLPRASRWLEIPPTGDVRLVVEELVLRPLDGRSAGLGRPEELANTLPDGRRERVHPADPAGLAAFQAGGFTKPVLLGDPVIFRDLRLVSLTFHPVVAHEGRLQRVESLRLRLDYDGVSAPAPALAWTSLPAKGGNEKWGSHGWSGNLERVYGDLVPNHGQFYSQVDESVFPVYLITGSPDYLSNPVYIEEFVRWKRQKGFDVRVVPFDQIPGGGQSISFGALRDWMRTQWQQLRPEYLLLVGDVDGAAACPDSVVQAHTGDYDVSDHFYACQEGDDYFPELFVGRFSVDNLQQLISMALKPVEHERDLQLVGDWLTKGLVVSCNYADSGTPPISPNQTSRWVIDKLRANGFTLGAGDSLFYPPLTDGGNQINSALNQGRGIVSYRGWANSNGWIYPAYDRDDIRDQLNNYLMMPVVGSFVCQTGAFGQGSGDIVVEDPCFGEQFVRHGSAGENRGAVAFVGPSDLHTRTQYNNPVCSGFFNAIFDLGLTSVGPALLNGKMELYNGYPLEREDRFSSYFYFHIYNVLGDADLKVWRAIPRRMLLEAPAALLPGQSVLEVWVRDADGQPVDDATLTLTAGDDAGILLARGVSVGGHALLTVDPALLTTGLSAVLTADHIDHMPAQAFPAVGAVSQALELTGLVVAQEVEDDVYSAGETLQVRLQLANRGGGTVPAGTAALRDPSQWETLPDHFVVVTGTAATPEIAPGGTATSSAALEIRLTDDVPDLATLHLVMDLSAGEFAGVADGRLEAANVALELVSAGWRSGAAQLLTDQVDTLDVVVRGSGSLPVADGSLLLASLDDRVEVVEGGGSLATLAHDEEAQLSFVLEGGAGLFSGQAVHVRLDLTVQGRTAHLMVPLPVGGILAEDPYGPDSHGYYAIESGDYDVMGHPEHEWLELDPAYGGGGATRLLLRDDDVAVIDLPFPVTQYGHTASRLSVCSNGWVSLGDTWIDDFRNWNLPSSLGPPNLIAAFWDDLKPQYVDGVNDSLHVPVYWRHDPAEGRVVISWSRTWNRYNYTAPDQPKQEFQLVFYDQAARPTPTGDTEILVQWKDVTDLDQAGNYATCGMENFGHDVGIQVSFANQPSPGCLGIGSGRSVLFTTRQPLHDSSFRVRVQEPLPQQWLTTRQPVLRWDHATLVDLLDRNDIDYHVVVDAAGTVLVDETVTGTGQLALADLGVDLPEDVALGFRLTAIAGELEFGTLQGPFQFYVDATHPTLTAALSASQLFPGHLELGVLASERLATLRAALVDGSNQEVALLVPDAGATDLSGGRELRFLRGSLDEGVSILRLTAVDLHGLDAQEDLPLAAVPFLAMGLRLPEAGLELGWRDGAGWAAALARRDGGDGRLLALGDGWRAVDVLLPEGARSATLSVAVPAAHPDAVLVQLRDGRWTAPSQHRDGASLFAELEGGGTVGLMAAGSVEEKLPAAFRLLGNHPNPFNPETRIVFELPAQGQPRLTVHNLAGALVRRLETGRLEPGRHEARWDGTDAGGAPVASGLYLARLEFEGQVHTQRMLLVR